MSNQRYEETFEYAFDENGLNGFNSDDLGLIVGKTILPVAPSMQENVQDIPAKYGEIYLGTDYQEKEFDIPVVCMCEDKEDFYNKIHNLSSVLVNSSRDKDVQYPLRFNDDPDTIYYGHFTSIPSPQFLSDNVFDFQLNLVFMLADPRGFLPQQQIRLTSNNQSIIPKGNTEVKPVIHIIPHTDLYYFGYEMDDKYVAVGYNVNAGNQLIDSSGNVVELGAHQTLQVDDPCTSLATWFQAGSDTQNVDVYKGVNDGKITSTPTSITVGKDGKGQLDFGKRNTHSYTKNGVSQENWYGPVIVHNGLPKVAPYWKMSVRLHHVKKDNRSKTKRNVDGIGNRAMGRVEAYLLDFNGDVRARMGIQDRQHGQMPVAYIQLGSSFENGVDKGRYKTLIWTNGPASQQRTDKKHDIQVSYKKTVMVKKDVSKKKKSSNRSLEYETRKRKYHKSAKWYKAHPNAKKTVTVNQKKNGGKKKSVAKPKIKTVKEEVTETKKVYSLNQRDAFSDFFGDFTLERQKADNGNDKWVARITRLSEDGVKPVTTGGKGVDIKGSLIDNKFGFSLANTALAFQKIDITEDKLNPPHIYKNDFLSATNYRVWKTDGSQDPDDTPHVIARAGQEIIIDNTDERVYVNGTSVDKYVSWGSSFPSITGSVPQTLHFSPAPENADIYIDYVPAIK